MANLQDLEANVSKLISNIRQNTVKDEADLRFAIKCRAVYDRLNNVLEKGSPQTTVEALNVLAVMLQIDVKNNNKTNTMLVSHAKNMTRISGCLNSISTIFCKAVMTNIDTWKAVCQCLTLACSDCECNQTYCTQLIPICIERCASMHAEVLDVLYSLLRNHSRNMQMFLECNGLTIFTREQLQNDKILLLFTTVVTERPDVVQLIINKAEVMDSLQDVIKIHGPESQTGQIAMIISSKIQVLLNTTLNVTQALPNGFKPLFSSTPKPKKLEKINTRIVRKKILKDKHLNLNKLKMGLHVYGCDFKKIARTMWPQDPHMTPKCLYKLYRKYMISLSTMSKAKSHL